jgi:hypothetical protein
MPSVSKKQHNLMALVANNPKAAKRLKIPQSVGEEFMKADKGKKFGGGGMALKSVDKDENPGLSKLPEGVRNKMGYMKKGGMAHSDIAKDKPMMEKVAKKAVKGHEKRMHKMAGGGKVGQLSKADGCATKGKSKGTMVKMKRGGAC